MSQLREQAALGNGRQGEKEAEDAGFHRQKCVADIDLDADTDVRDVLGGLSGLIVIDEFQRQPDLFPIWIS